MSIETRINSSCDLLELGTIVDNISNELRDYEEDKKYNYSYDFFIRYSYLLKLKKDALDSAKKIYDGRRKNRESHF